MFRKILIANRGEIACRIAKTAKRLGIRTVAVYSDADAAAPHVALCDAARHIGGPAPRDSYLNGPRIVAAARQSGAEAVHPGYGFLSENAEFAALCREAGLVFIGPPPSAIRAMGSKSQAKEIMGAAGVPLIPGYHGESQDPEILRRAAEEIGYPVLIKAAYGGGGRGMRVVERPAELSAALQSAKREAAAAFGNDRLLLEKYLSRPRHIELQVFADQQGSTLHLFERDCSVQRRHQKVLEEAPAPGMTAQRRRQMGEAAVAAARAVGYVGAGTVEFIVDSAGEFYFMEMNTRLQVEHPVTEMITGLDLVEWQLRIAAGEPLPLSQEQIALRGHAIEARVYAEDPGRDFLPATGRLDHLRFPEASPHVRVDAGVREGDAITVHYDPMIAKLIVWDEDRDAALRRLRGALAEFQVAGLVTNLPFLAAVAAHPAFAEAHRETGGLDTGLIDRHRDELIPLPRPADDSVLALAALSELLRVDREVAAHAARSGDPTSPWHYRDGWRLNQDHCHALQFKDGEQIRRVTAHFRRNGYLLELPESTVEAAGELDEAGRLTATLGGAVARATVVRRGGEITVIGADGCHALTLHNPWQQSMEEEDLGSGLLAPMPGTVIRVGVAAGELVEKGAPLMVLEAMKMEHTLRAPADGRVTEIFFAAGEQVAEGAQLLAFEAEAKP